MNKALMQSTQVTVTFSVTVSTDSEHIWLTLPLILLTPIMFLWQAMQTMKHVRHRLILLTLDITDLLTFIATVIIITLKSFAYGFGVKL